MYVIYYYPCQRVAIRVAVSVVSWSLAKQGRKYTRFLTDPPSPPPPVLVVVVVVVVVRRACTSWLNTLYCGHGFSRQTTGIACEGPGGGFAGPFQ